MLEALTAKLRCVACEAGEALDLDVLAPGADHHVEDGLLTCPACGTIYPIADGLLELVVPALQDSQAFAALRARFGARVRQTVSAAVDDATLTAQRKQREHFDWFAEAADQNYDAYQRTPFWRSADRAAFAGWVPRLRPTDWILDVGCANGRSAWPLTGSGATIVGFDISRKQIAQAIAHSRRNGTYARTTFLVADAARVPFRDESFDVALTYGALHHVPDPGRTCREIQRVLRVGGVHLGSENNQSALRPVFDWLMRIKQLWVEEAGEQPLISERMIRQWTSGLPATVSCRTHVFVPPHLVNLLGVRAGGRLVQWTDALGGALPALSRHGGLLLFEIQRERA
jgi:ubiquinone/menaquinone biosynthesis C-methylase UbiE/uncharacterized protein YbaR (Trm112 family)